MQDLTALKELKIEGCLKLSRRCRKKKRKRKKDRPKIAHVQVVDLDKDYGSSSETDDDISLNLSEEDYEVRANLFSCSSCTIMGLTLIK